MYNVFIDTPSRRQVAALNFERAYDASAVADMMVDAGYSVFTDLWFARIHDAMVSPDVFERFDLGNFPTLPASD